jgi:transposase
MPISKTVTRVRLKRHEMAVGIGFNGDDFLARVLGKSGDMALVGDRLLGDRGLPQYRNGLRRELLTVDLSSWNLCSPKAYLDFYDLAPESFNHQIFQFHEGGDTFYVPALALMRALFRPVKMVLPSMFRPNGLIRTFCPVLANDQVSVTTSNRWRCDSINTEGNKNSFLAPAAWMFAFPSASLMCFSVNEFAEQGILGLNLPQGMFTFVAHYDSNWTGNYIASMVISHIETKETPFEFATSQTRFVHFHLYGKQAKVRHSTALAVDNSIPLHDDGSVELTDAEWMAIQPVIVPRKAGRRSIDPRKLLNAILRKLTSKMTWKTISKETGLGSIVGVTYKRLTDGLNPKMNIILEILKQTRGAMKGEGKNIRRENKELGRSLVSRVDLECQSKNLDEAIGWRS